MRVVQPQPAPAFVAELAQGFDVALEDVGGVGKGHDGTVDACFAQQVQGGIRRAVGVVVDVVGVAAGEFIARMQAGDLDDAGEFEAADRGIGFGQEEMEVEKIAHDFRVDQQCRFEYLGVGLGKYQQFMLDFGEQFVVGPRSGHGMANLPLDVHCLGKRAQVEADDRALEPDLRGGDNLDGEPVEAFDDAESTDPVLELS